MALLLVPAALFFGILWSHATTLPIGADDYHAILEFANHWTQIHGFVPKLMHILTFQQNEYKLLFESALVAAQFGILGHIELSWFIVLGNAFVLLIFFVLASIFMTTLGVAEQSLRTRLLLLAPVSLLLFQLQYATTLDWAMGALQNITVIFFSLWSILLLSRQGRGAFLMACAAMLLAISCSGNGFMIGPVGLLMLLQQRRWRDGLLWAAAILLMMCLYFFHYNFRSSQAVPGDTVGHAFLHFSPLYGLSFLGSSVARYESTAPSIAFGVVLCAVFVLAVVKRYYRTNPAVFFSMVFVLMTALGVAGLRSNLGIVQSLASRYRIYSNLMLIFAYMFLVQTLLLRGEGLRLQSRRVMLAAAVVLCVVFCGMSDLAGNRFLKGRRAAVQQEMTTWLDHHQGSSAGVAAAAASASAEDDPALRRQMERGIYRPETPILLESIRLGVYRPPALRSQITGGTP